MRGLVLLGFLLLAPAFVGCVTSDEPAATSGSAAASLAPELSAPHVDAAKTLAALKIFSEAYPYRQSGTATHAAARDNLEATFKAAGLETMRQRFATDVGPATLPYEGQNILGIKWGADRQHWVVVGAHYDITEGAVYGTYDDGSGTILTTKLAEAFAKLNTTRTVAFIEFDQEERGLVGSTAFVKAVQEGTFPISGVEIDAMIDLDMVGITWPHPAHLICWQNSESLKNETKTLANRTGMPADHLDFRPPAGGSSDGAAFIRVGIATAYFWSDWDDYILPTGAPEPHSPVPYAGAYPWWHKLDTYDTMVASAGDEATLTKGFQTTLDIVSPLLMWAASPAFSPDGVTPAA